MLLRPSDEHLDVIHKSLKKDQLHKYSFTEYFVDHAAQFLSFMQTVSFSPTRDAAREYLIAVGGIEQEGDARSFEGDIDQVLRNYRPALAKHFCTNQGRLLKVFVELLMENIFEVRTSVNSYYGSMERIDKQSMLTLIDVLKRENPLPELTIMNVIEAKVGYDISNREVLHYDYTARFNCAELKPHVKVLTGLLIQRCISIQNANLSSPLGVGIYQQDINVVLKALDVIVGGHTSGYSSGTKFRLQNACSLQGDWRPTISTLTVECIINTTNILDVWGAVNHDKAVETSEVNHNALCYIVNMGVLSLIHASDMDSCDKLKNAAPCSRY